MFVLISIILWKEYVKYEDYKNEPYITVRTGHNSGLNNRIQAIFSYLYKANKEGKKLRIIWVNSKHCPEDYKNLFEPIPNVEIIYSKLIDEDIYDYDTAWKQNREYLKTDCYKLLKPIKSIQIEIDIMIEKLQKPYIACHLRRTDGWNHNPYKKDRHTDEEYMEFIDQYPTELNIYISTDCRITQQKFIEKYADRLIYKKIDDNNDIRQTSLQDAVKDMYICADATYFMRSPGTFSDTIMHLRYLNNK